MRAALPKQVCAARVTVLAHCVLLGKGIWGILAEAHGNCVFAAAGLDVGSARAVTRLTAAGFQRSSGMGEGLAHGRILEAVILVLMAGNAGLAAHVVAVSGCTGGSFGFLLFCRRFRRVLALRPRVQANSQAKRSQE